MRRYPLPRISEKGLHLPIGSPYPPEPEEESEMALDYKRLPKRMKRCPYCGGPRASLRQVLLPEEDGTRARCYCYACPRCHAEGPRAETIEEAAMLYNQRAGLFYLLWLCLLALLGKEKVNGFLG